MFRRWSFVGAPGWDSSFASMTARTASSISRLASRRCSTSSGRASPSAVTAMQMGQKETEQIGCVALGVGSALDAATPSGRSSGGCAGSGLGGIGEPGAFVGGAAERPVRAALIWTDVPDLMEIPASAMDRELAAVTSA